MSFFAAFQFLTGIPLPRREIAPEKLGSSTAYFPLVGLIIGIILAGLNWLLNHVLPPQIVNVLMVAALVMITGALHLDGLADTFDGIAGHKSVEERWEVMRDSHSGAFGVIGIVLVLLVKYVSLNSLPEPLLMANLIFMPVVSRWAMVYAIFAHPYARPSGLGTAFKQGTRWLQFTLATVITLAVAIVLFPFFSVTGLLMIPGIWVVIALFSWYLKRKFSGLTGDTYGAINEVAEVTALILANLVYTVAWQLR